MGKRLRILVAAFLLVALAVLAWAFLFARDLDPVYEGKHLSEWIEEFDPAEGPTAPAAEALSHFGADATPALNRMLRAQDFGLKIRFFMWLAKVMQLRAQIAFQPALISRQHALDACGFLGTNASGTVPALVGLIDNSPGKTMNQGDGVRALDVLARMEAQGLQGLIHAVTNRDPTVQYRAIRLLGTSSGPVTPAMSAVLESTAKSANQKISYAASEALDLIKERRQQKIPLAALRWADKVVSPEDTGANLWDVKRGLQVTTTSGLLPGFQAETVFGGAPSASPEGGSTIFQDGRPDRFVHTIEWELPAAVTVRSVGVIARHDAAGGDLFRRSFGSFRLLAWDEQSGKYEPCWTESVSVPYGNGFCSAMLAAFRNLETPVTARRFRAEFVQHDSGAAGDGPRLLRLCAFSVPLNLPTAQTALRQPGSVFDIEIQRTIQDLAGKRD